MSPIDILLWCAAILAIVATLSISLLLISTVILAVAKAGKKKPVDNVTNIYSSRVMNAMIDKELRDR